MATPTTLLDGPLAVVDYHCTAGPADRPYAERHVRHSLSFVRRGSFGYATCGHAYELVPGAVLRGHPGDEFTCSHAHHAAGDDCVCVTLAPALADTLDDAPWTSGALPPLPALAVAGERLAAAAHGRDAERLLAAAWDFLACHARSRDGAPRHASVLPRERKRLVNVALWLDSRAEQPLDVAAAARAAHMSPFHFLRCFARVVGQTPYQYLIGARLRRAARLLAEDTLPITAVAAAVGFGDLSNFVRTFGRASGASPTAFRRLAHEGRSILQAPSARGS